MFVSKVVIPKNADISMIDRMFYLSTGGIALLSCCDKSRAAEWYASQPAVVLEHNVTIDDHYVMVLEEVLDYLTPAELTAVLGHEEGHYELGHLDNLEAGVVVNQEFEYAADAYSVSKGNSPAVMISALNNIVTFTMEFVLPQMAGGAENLSEEIAQIIRTSIEAVITPRIARLEAMSVTVH